MYHVKLKYCNVSRKTKILWCITWKWWNAINLNRHDNFKQLKTIIKSVFLNKYITYFNIITKSQKLQTIGFNERTQRKDYNLKVNTT